MLFTKDLITCSHSGPGTQYLVVQVGDLRPRTLPQAIKTANAKLAGGPLTILTVTVVTQSIFSRRARTYRRCFRLCRGCIGRLLHLHSRSLFVVMEHLQRAAGEPRASRPDRIQRVPVCLPC